MKALRTLRFALQPSKKKRNKKLQYLRGSYDFGKSEKGTHKIVKKQKKKTVRESIGGPVNFYEKEAKPNLGVLSDESPVFRMEPTGSTRRPEPAPQHFLMAKKCMVSWDIYAGHILDIPGLGAQRSIDLLACVCVQPRATSCICKRVYLCVRNNLYLHFCVLGCVHLHLWRRTRKRLHA